jgi:hypothetical protein
MNYIVHIKPFHYDLLCNCFWQVKKQHARVRHLQRCTAVSEPDAGW